MSDLDQARTMRGSNHSGMRQFNERIVLQAIRHQGAIPKADLARLTQLSSQTVAIIVGRLLGEGLLLKQERVRGKIGQPSVPLSLNPQGAFGIGVQVGRRSLEWVVADFCGQVVERLAFRYAQPSPQHVLACIASGLSQLQARLGERWARVVGLGLTAPLFMHQWADLMGPEGAAALSGWRDFDLLAEVRALTELPVDFAKDTNAACVAELLQGHGRRSRAFLYVFVGTFVGGGLVLGGHLVAGERGNAGAIGSLPLGLRSADQSAPGQPRQLLQQASGWQLEQRLLGAGLDPLLVHQPQIMAPEWATHTQAWLAEAAPALALTVASAAALLDLDAVVIDGSLGEPLMDALMQHTEQALAGYRFDGMHRPQLLRGQVGAHARALGGALLPLHSQFSPDKDIFLKQDNP